ncbi:MAG: 2,3-bisphosphoglycerate-independent phosphoglycerate mutase [Eubacteriales bacterium]
MANKVGTAKPLMLMIIDGWGYSSEEEGNAVLEAKMPNLTCLMDIYPKTLLKASGIAVGLPEGQMGNSEVGHLNIGAGRVVYQEFTRITKAVENGEILDNAILRETMKKIISEDKPLHLIGLLSDGGVHSHIKHLFSLLEMAKKSGVKEVYVHPILDGRDVLPQSAKTYIIQLEQKLKDLKLGKIATVSGRYYAMDRDKHWDRIEKAYRAFVYSEGQVASCALAAVDKSYESKVIDEFVLPTVIVGENGEPIAQIKDGDSIIFFNFRADRAREITSAFIEEEFDGFERSGRPKVNYVCLTEYDVNFNCPKAFPPQNLENTMGKVLEKNGQKQLRIAETEKYAHVTFFFNGGVEEPSDGEERCLIPSPNVATYNLKPEMSAYEITDTLLKKMEENEYDVVVLNFANADMVGHTGNMEATVKGLEAVDVCIGKIADEMLRRGATLLITADHGNAECMIDTETGSPLTCHTLNKVPFIIVDDYFKGRVLRSGAALCDIAPTMLDLLEIDIPKEMTGKSLLEIKKAKF